MSVTNHHGIDWYKHIERVLSILYHYQTDHNEVVQLLKILQKKHSLMHLT